MASLSYIESFGFVAWATKKTISLKKKKSTVNNEMRRKKKERDEEGGEGPQVTWGGGVSRKKGI